MRCPQMGPSCGSPRPICLVLATTLALLPMPWERRPNTRSSMSWVSARLPPASQVSTNNHCHSFCYSKDDRKIKQKSNQVSGLHSNPSIAFPVIIHDQTVTVPTAGAGKGSFESRKQLAKKSPSSEEEPRRLRLNIEALHVESTLKGNTERLAMHLVVWLRGGGGCGLPELPFPIFITQLQHQG